MSLESAWQAALATEQQAVFGYGLLGPRLTSTDDISLARADEAAHVALRDATAAALAAAGFSPVAPQADYPTLYPVPDDAAAQRLAVRLEAEAAAAWRYLYAVAATQQDAAGKQATAIRRAAQAALIDSAVRAAQWRGAPVPFPGL